MLLKVTLSCWYKNMGEHLWASVSGWNYKGLGSKEDWRNQATHTRIHWCDRMQRTWSTFHPHSRALNTSRSTLAAVLLNTAQNFCWRRSHSHPGELVPDFAQVSALWKSWCCPTTPWPQIKNKQTKSWKSCVAAVSQYPALQQSKWAWMLSWSPGSTTVPNPTA